MAGYGEWFTGHGNAVNAIIDRLLAGGADIDEIVNYFTYENMVEKEPDFCPLFRQGKKCHDVVNLNCLLCGCPYFRFSDNGIYSRGKQVVYSECVKHLGSEFELPDAVHHDCSRCLIPHNPRFVRRALQKHGYDWFAIMENVII